MNVIDYALRMENEGEHLFELLSHEMEDPERKEIYELLASAEKDHIEKLESLKKLVDPEDARSTMAERARNLPSGFGKLLGNGDLLHKLRYDEDGFVHVIKAEEENISLLEGMAAVDPNEKARALLSSIVEEEKEHLTMMEYIYEFLEAPHTYLEWGEFANIHQL
ncbi:MAG TPA: ferritin family protein [Geobacteraceae bacterium]